MTAHRDSATALRPEEVARYREHGYLLPKRQLFEPTVLDNLTGIFEEHLANKGGRLSDQLDTPHLEDPRLLDFLLADEVLDVVEPILGPNIGLFSSHFICKDPVVGRPTPWHEDSSYWRPILNPYDGIVTVWLALDRSTRENGCMRVIAGSHDNGFSNYESLGDAAKDYTFGSQIIDIDESKAVYFELERGQYSLHDARLIHGAEANRSSDRRCGYTMRYFSTHVHIHHRRPEFKVWLARGVDLAGNEFANV